MANCCGNYSLKITFQFISIQNLEVRRSKWLLCRSKNSIQNEINLPHSTRQIKLGICHV